MAELQNESLIRDKFKRLRELASKPSQTPADTQEAFAIAMDLGEIAFTALIKLIDRAAR
jgi:hypothetical protein